MTWLAHSSVATIVEKDGLFLMVEETENGRRVFNQPAGHLEDNETLFEAARRETLEESAWDVQLQALVGLYHWKVPATGQTFIRHCFIATALEHHPGRALDDGIVAAHWLGAERILSPDFSARSPIVQLCLRDYLDGRSYPLELIHHLP